VALKVLRTGLGNTNLERRFRREIEVLRRLDHPGIARLLDAGTDETGAPWLATEYIDGVTLNRWRVETESTTEQRVLLLAELCDAVHAAHGHGVIHRDLKPENVLVTREGRPKVLDFGIARLQNDSVPLATLVTQTWQLLGTIRYMSPEQAAGGAAAIDERTDIYTLGVIAYELLAGTLPYNLSRLSTPRALLEITTAEPRPLSGRDSAIDLIIQHALAKDPGQRYPTAAAMADDLRRQAENKSISLRRPGPTARIKRALRTRPTPAAPGARDGRDAGRRIGDAGPGDGRQPEPGPELGNGLHHHRGSGYAAAFGTARGGQLPCGRRPLPEGQVRTGATAGSTVHRRPEPVHQVAAR
jgi:serine/threonine protein kinase